MAEWLVIRAVAPEIIWARYADAVGLEKLQAVFGDNWPPARQRVLEEVYCWRDRSLSPRPFDPTDHPAAWMSLSLDQFDPQQAFMSRGVWPDQHGQGLGRAMRAWAEQWCRDRSVKTLNIFVNACNAQHLVSVLNDPYWQMDAVILGRRPCFGFFHPIDAAPAPDPKPEG